MKTEKLVHHLSEVVRRLGYRLRIEDGNFRGGTCMVGDQKMVILNRRMNADERAELLARVLRREDLETIYLVPEVRAFVEKMSGDPVEAAGEIPIDDGRADQ